MTFWFLTRFIMIAIIRSTSTMILNRVHKVLVVFIIIFNLFGMIKQGCGIGSDHMALLHCRLGQPINIF